MAFRIVEIVGSEPEGIVAKVGHQDNLIAAVIASRKPDNAIVGSSLEAEIGYDEILSWKVMGDFDDANSGIRQEQDGIHLLGRIHSILDYGDGKTLVEVYMQNGSEVFQIDLDAMSDADLEANSGLEIIVGKLYIYPRG